MSSAAILRHVRDLTAEIVTAMEEIDRPTTAVDLASTLSSAVVPVDVEEQLNALCALGVVDRSQTEAGNDSRTRSAYRLTPRPAIRMGITDRALLRRHLLDRLATISDLSLAIEREHWEELERLAPTYADDLRFMIQMGWSGSPEPSELVCSPDLMSRLFRRIAKEAEGHRPELAEAVNEAQIELGYVIKLQNLAERLSRGGGCQEAAERDGR